MPGMYITAISRSCGRFNLLRMQINYKYDYWHEYLRRSADCNTACGCQHDTATVL